MSKAISSQLYCISSAR